MRTALTQDMLATDVADYLAKKGMPFREAHHIVGQAVQMAAEQEIPLSQLPLEHFQSLSNLFEPDVVAVFDFDASVSRRTAPGSTAPEAVKQQIEQAKDWLAAHERATNWTQCTIESGENI
jgi:argininosuccinate lyase